MGANQELKISTFVVDTARRNTDEIKRAFDSRGLPIFFFPAVWGRDLTAEALEGYFDLDKTNSYIGWRDAHIGELGCTISHQLIYKKAFLLDCQWVLIIEDDIIMTNELLDFVESFEFESSVPTVVSLYSRGKRYVRRNGQISLPKGELFKCITPPGGTQCYLINRAALAIALEQKKMSGIADWPKWSLSTDFFLAFPYLIPGDSVDSLIESYELTRKQYWKWRISVICGVHFIRNRRLYESYHEYFSIHLIPWICRVMSKMGLFERTVSDDGNDIWICRLF